MPFDDCLYLTARNSTRCRARSDLLHRTGTDAEGRVKRIEQSNRFRGSEQSLQALIPIAANDDEFRRAAPKNWLSCSGYVAFGGN